MTTTPPAGYCRRCATPFGIGAAVCSNCGLQVSVVLAERAPATPVYGAPPSLTMASPAVETAPVQPAPVDEDGFVDPDPSYQPQFAASAPPRRFDLSSVDLTKLKPTKLPVPGFDPRRTRDIVVGGVLLLALILGSLWAWTYAQNRPVHDSLATAGAAYAKLLDAMDGASSLREVRRAADVAAEAADVLANTQMELAARSGDLADAALDVVAGQHQVAIAASRLNAVSERKLDVWGSVEGSLAEARERLMEARGDLADVDGEEAGRFDDPAAAIDNVRTVVGHAATRVLGSSVTSLVDKLGSARRTAQVRDLAAQAHDQSAVVSAALVGLTGDSAAAVGAIGDALDQVALLEGLDAEHLDAWKDARVGLVSALGVLAETDGVAKEFAEQATRAVDNLDGLVSAGELAMQQWKADLARAKKKQARAQRTLATYDDAVKEQLTTYQELRSELEAFLTQVTAPGEELDAREVLDSAVEGRREVLAALKELTPPVPIEESHAALVGALDEAVRAVKTASDELDKAYYCKGCDYATSESYQKLSAASEELAASFSEEEHAWRDSVGRLKVRISDKSLPRKPVV